MTIAVDRVVDPLRSLVTFTNSASRFGMYLLEIQQFRAPDGLQVASINVYGGAAPKKDGGGRTQWDESRFLETLRAQCPSDSVVVVEELYAFMQEQADSIVWGTGTKEGSAGFAVSRGGVRLVMFGVTTNGGVYFSTGTMNKKGVSRELTGSLLATLRSFGVDAPDKLIDSWVAFDADRLKKSDDRDRLKSAVLEIRDSVRGDV